MSLNHLSWRKDVRIHEAGQTNSGGIGKIFIYVTGNFNF